MPIPIAEAIYIYIYTYICIIWVYVYNMTYMLLYDMYRSVKNICCVAGVGTNKWTVGSESFSTNHILAYSRNIQKSSTITSTNNPIQCELVCDFVEKCISTFGSSRGNPNTLPGSVSRRRWKWAAFAPPIPSRYTEMIWKPGPKEQMSQFTLGILTHISR